MFAPICYPKMSVSILLRSINVMKNGQYVSLGCRLSTTPKVITAGVIVIGDEILKGDTLDTNSNFASKILFHQGVKLKKISIVGDNIQDISGEVRSFSDLYDFVITSGGIGPTHDDITFEAVAEAFNQPLVANKVLKELCSNYFTQTSPAMKLCQVPASAKLNIYEELKFPSISVGNVYIFPGIPQFFQKAFSVVAKDVFKSVCRFFTKSVYFNVMETDILVALNKTVGEFPDVLFGSYPRLDCDVYKVKITIQSTNELLVNEALQRLLQLAPKGSIAHVDCPE